MPDRTRLEAVIFLATIVFCAGVLVSTAQATPFWGEEEVAAFLQRGGSGADGAAPGLSLPPLTGGERTTSYADEYALIANFQRTWQVTIPGPDFGGIREGEHLPDIIQTDNTSEAIWVWTRYYELTGDNQYYPNIQNAFAYSMTNPAYLEEGGSTPQTGYYRMYNCGWAVRAALKYRDVYGDATYQAYADSCGSYLRDHSLIRYGSPFYDAVNVAVLSWAMGNLYWAGVHEGRPDWINAAVQQSRDRVKVWVDGLPSLLGNETWAMSGGATMWGLLNSYFLAVPDSTQPWLARRKANMDVFSSPGQFTNAWNGWYALGHRATGLALGNDNYHLGVHISLTDYLINEDADSDGGLPARPEDTDQMDQTWVSNYLAFMGLSDGLGPASSVAERVSSLRLSCGPNPFTGSATVRFQVPDASPVRVTVHDPAGRQVAVLLQKDLTAGPQVLDWDTKALPAGIYWVAVQSNRGVESRRVVHLR